MKLPKFPRPIFNIMNAMNVPQPSHAYWTVSQELLNCYCNETFICSFFEAVLGSCSSKWMVENPDWAYQKVRLSTSPSCPLAKVGAAALGFGLYPCEPRAQNALNTSTYVGVLHSSTGNFSTWVILAFFRVLTFMAETATCSPKEIFYSFLGYRTRLHF